MSEMRAEDPLPFTGPCPRCFAVSLGHWPHGDGEPCPLAVEELEREQVRRDVANVAYIQKLEAEAEAARAQGDYYTRAQMPMLDMAEMARTVTQELGGHDHEED